MTKKNWNILTIIILALTALMCLFVLFIFIDPQSGLNLFAPPTLPPLMSLPSSTPTLRKLPPSWTPGTGPEIVETVSLKASSTMAETNTPVPFNTFTNTPTRTNTPTNTPTPTNTATITPTATTTKTQTATQNLTATELSRLATSIAETEAVP